MMNLRGAVLRTFFRYLYTSFAGAYDFVAWAVSIGQWRSWQSSILPMVPPGPTLELGHGPGHLLLTLAKRGHQTIGVDISGPMVRLAARRLRESGFESRVVQADSGSLPFPREAFRSVISTFPSDYILEIETLGEAWRVLIEDGLLLVIPGAQITGASWPDRFAAWLFRTLGQTGEPGEEWEAPFRQAGFSPKLEEVQHPRARVLCIIAAKDSLGA